MLDRLHIENMAVIETADLDLPAGLTVLTGETGAGKSVLIHSFNLLLGERVSRDVIRAGSAKATASAVFSDLPPSLVSAMDEAGLDTEEGETVIQRDLSADGKSSVHVSGRPVTVSMLREWSGRLINIHGQNDNRALLDPSTHGRYLDAFARDQKQLSDYREVFTELRSVLSRIKEVSLDEQERSRRMEFLEYQIAEIDALALKPGETDDLQQRRAVLANAERIVSAVSEAYEAISGEAQGKDRLFSASAELSRVAQIDPALDQIRERLNDVCSELEDVAYDLREYADAQNADPAELDVIEERLDLIRKAERKYGVGYDALTEFRAKAAAELETLRSSAQTLDELNLRKERLIPRLKQAALSLTEARRGAIPLLEAALTEQMTFLDMPHTRFSVRLDAAKQFTPNGADEIEFLLSVNPGQPLQPLSRIASGGELSRIMLAMKTVLWLDDDAKTLVFDEIDAGVSGKAAEKIAMKLKELSRGRQVIVVTHLAQIAAYADTHFLIAKRVAEGQTYTDVTRLDENGRAEELARIMGGMFPTEATFAAARELRQTGAEYLK